MYKMNRNGSPSLKRGSLEPGNQRGYNDDSRNKRPRYTDPRGPQHIHASAVDGPSQASYGNQGCYNHGNRYDRIDDRRTGGQGVYNGSNRWQQNSGNQSNPYSSRDPQYRSSSSADGLRKQSLPNNYRIIYQYKQGWNQLNNVLKVTVSCINKSIQQGHPGNALTLLKNLKDFIERLKTFMID